MPPGTVTSGATRPSRLSCVPMLPPAQRFADSMPQLGRVDSSGTGGGEVAPSGDGPAPLNTMPTSPPKTSVLTRPGPLRARGVLRRDVRGARPAAAALPRARRAARGAQRRGVRGAAARGRRLVPQPGHRLHRLRRGGRARADLPVRPDPARDPAAPSGTTIERGARSSACTRSTSSSPTSTTASGSCATGASRPSSCSARATSGAR